MSQIHTSQKKKDTQPMETNLNQEVQKKKKKLLLNAPGSPGQFKTILDKRWYQVEFIDFTVIEVNSQYSPTGKTNTNKFKFKIIAEPIRLNEAGKLIVNTKNEFVGRTITQLTKVYVKTQRGITDFGSLLMAIFDVEEIEELPNEIDEDTLAGKKVFAYVENSEPHEREDGNVAVYTNIVQTKSFRRFVADLRAKEMKPDESAVVEDAG